MTQIVLVDRIGKEYQTEAIPIIDQSALSGMRSVQATVEGQGAVSAVVIVYGCNDKRYPIEVMRFTLTGSNLVSDFGKDNMPFEYYIVKIQNITGTGAVVSVAASV